MKVFNWLAGQIGQKLAKKPTFANDNANIKLCWF